MREPVDAFRTKKALAIRFGRHRAAQVLIGGAIVVVAVRVALAIGGTADLGVADGLAVGIGVGLIGIVEWIAHRLLFHAPQESRRARILRTGESHRRHHLDPTDLGWVLLAPSGAVALMVGVAALVAVWAFPISLLTGEPSVGPYLSAVVIGWLAIANYEWTHLLVHSAYRPKTRRYRRLARNHRLHHFRDETSLFGVSSNAGDRLFRTLGHAGTTVRATS